MFGSGIRCDEGQVGVELVDGKQPSDSLSMALQHC